MSKQQSKLEANSVYCIGETVFDIIFDNNQPIASFPGGAMLNTAVSLGRLGVKSSLITAVGNDHIADIFVDFLSKNNVNTTFIIRSNANTSLALAFLDDKKNASYNFYKTPMPEQLFSQTPFFLSGDIVIFGSSFGINQSIRLPLLSLIKKAKAAGARIFYDPNCRKHHSSHISSQQMICENLALADIVRGSDEDFDAIFNTNNPEKVAEFFRKINKKGILIITCGPKETHLFLPDSQFVFAVESINPLSTIGAGDSFNAGIIFALCNNYNNWNKIIETASICAKSVCLSYENYISNNCAERLLECCNQII